jgi:hypothetical protein
MLTITMLTASIRRLSSFAINKDLAVQFGVGSCTAAAPSSSRAQALVKNSLNAPIQYCRGCSTSSSSPGRNNNADDNIATKEKLYLHIGPSGDCWTGSSIFAAKHLQPDYVKSVEIPSDVDVDALVQLIDDDSSAQTLIYDNASIPHYIMKKLKELRCWRHKQHTGPVDKAHHKKSRFLFDLTKWDKDWIVYLQLNNKRVFRSTEAEEGKLHVVCDGYYQNGENWFLSCGDSRVYRQYLSEVQGSVSCPFLPQLIWIMENTSLFCSISFSVNQGNYTR